MTWPNLMRNCNKIAFACGLYVCALQLERVISVISAITLARNTISAELVLSLSLPPCQSSVWVWIGQAVTVQEYGSSSNVWLNHRHFVLGIKLQQWHLVLGAWCLVLCKTFPCALLSTLAHLKSWSTNLSETKGRLSTYTWLLFLKSWLSSASKS